ncbi:MAG: hypothetical protein V4629_05800 [Pseudomonadota bacterium]
MFKKVSFTNKPNVINPDGAKTNNIVTSLNKIESTKKPSRNRAHLNIDISNYSPLRSLSPIDIRMAALTPREIQLTTPRLTKETLIAQSFMQEPIEIAHLKTTECPSTFLWDHPKFNGEPEKIINYASLLYTEDQPVGGDSDGVKMESLFYYWSGSSAIKECYVKITSSQHAFAQKGTEQLYNLLFESTGMTPVPENYLCFDLDNLDRGIIGIASRINPNLVTLENFCDNLQRFNDKYDVIANKMLEALEPLHRIVGNHDVHQNNVMIEINPETQEPIRPQILDLGDTFIFWERGIPVYRARSPQITDQLHGPFIHLEDRQFTERELSPLEKFISCRNPASHSLISDSRILFIVNRYFSGSESTRNEIAHTIQARINSTYSRAGLNEDDEYLQDQRDNPKRYNDLLDNHVYRY